MRVPDYKNLSVIPPTAPDDISQTEFWANFHI